MHADNAIYTVIEEQAAALESLDDEYLKERATDIRDIGTRWVKKPLGINIVSLANINEQVIPGAYDLTPSETAQINLTRLRSWFPAGIGGHASITSIMARS